MNGSFVSGEHICSLLCFNREFVCGTLSAWTIVLLSGLMDRIFSVVVDKGMG